MTLERVALHQTRLRTPGLTLDAQGVAVGAQGAVLFPSIDRLVAFLAVYSQERPLDDIAPTLSATIVRSPLGAREALLTFASDTSDRMDRVAHIARLTLGHVFTGGGRHWVQYRDAAAPFGYDIVEIEEHNQSLVLYHSLYTQAFETEKKIDLRALLLTLHLHPDALQTDISGPLLLLAEGNLGELIISYFYRSKINARATVLEWPPESDLDDEPVRRHLFDIPELPPRMISVFRSTPGLTLFRPVSPGAAVELGYKHPVQLQALPSFRGPGMVLFRASEQPLLIVQQPIFAPVDSLTRFKIRETDYKPAIKKLNDKGTSAEPSHSKQSKIENPIVVPLRVTPSMSPRRQVTASFIAEAEWPLLRRLLYVLGPETLRRSSLAITSLGAFVRCPEGVDVLPLGVFFRGLSERLYIPAGFTTSPSIDASVIEECLGLSRKHVTILHADNTAIAIPDDAFVGLQTAIVMGHQWATLQTTELSLDLSQELPTELIVKPLGFNPLGDVGLHIIPHKMLPNTITNLLVLLGGPWDRKSGDDP